jgi:hypothetical protein
MANAPYLPVIEGDVFSVYDDNQIALEFKKRRHRRSTFARSATPAVSTSCSNQQISNSKSQ